MKIYIASDHAGYELKEKIIEYLIQEGKYDVADKGPFEYNENDDYPDFVSKVAEEVSKKPNEVKGIILGGSGQGEAMVANRFENVRAFVYYGGNEEIVRLSREHNDANVLSLGARFINEEETKRVLKIWLETGFSDEERHVRRIEKMDGISNNFDYWNKLKQKINKKEKSNLYVHEREIWWCSLGTNIGFEQNGSGELFLRPVVIIKKFGANTCLVVPLSKTTKSAWYRHRLIVDNEDISALVTQVRVVDLNRFVEKKTTLEKDSFLKLKNKITELYK